MNVSASQQPERVCVRVEAENPESHLGKLILAVDLAWTIPMCHREHRMTPARIAVPQTQESGNLHKRSRSLAIRSGRPEKTGPSFPLPPLPRRVRPY
jgi:hypothetical protein